MEKFWSNLFSSIELIFIYNRTKQGGSIMARNEETTGTIYGDFKILNKDKEKSLEKKRAYYYVQCIHCNNYFSKTGSDLRLGKNQCPICKKNNKQKEEIGNQYGKLTVIAFDHIADDRRYVWKCRCDCGNIITARITALHNGSVFQCQECAKQERASQAIDETGNIYGKLTVLQRDFSKPNSQKNAYWLCQCECGNKVIVKGTKLRNGQQSCGCIKSKGELKINQLLTNNNISYKTQIQFEDCKYINNLSFDFGIYDDNNILLYLIEYDGEQHYKCSQQGWNTLENLEQTKIRDKIKNEWCKNNNIPLIRIPYTIYETLNINDLKLETTQYLI